MSLTTLSGDRLERIARARQLVLQGHPDAPVADVSPWITQSWQRCLSLGLEPDKTVGFDAISAQHMHRVQEASRPLVQAAQPVLAELARAIADIRYFAILTNAQGIVVDVHGPVDRQDRRADVIARVGVDLSEKAVGTTAISAALTELQPVWRHRGEHFFKDTSAVRGHARFDRHRDHRAPSLEALGSPLGPQHRKQLATVHRACPGAAPELARQPAR